MVSLKTVVSTILKDEHVCEIEINRLVTQVGLLKDIVSGLEMIIVVLCQKLEKVENRIANRFKIFEMELSASSVRADQLKTDTSDFRYNVMVEEVNLDKHCVKLENDMRRTKESWYAVAPIWKMFRRLGLTVILSFW